MFDDGGIPKIENITEWLKVVDEFYDNNKEEQAVLESAQKENNKKQFNLKGQGKAGPARIAVHCVAGLGRAPLMVALALVHKGCQSINAI